MKHRVYDQRGVGSKWRDSKTGRWVVGPNFIIHGTARPKGKSDARTPELATDHIFETRTKIENIDAQEELLNLKYPELVHFDTYIEEPA